MSSFSRRVLTPGSAPRRARRPRTSYHHGDLRAALLEAVTDVIRERGLGAVSLREAARRAQVSHGAPAHHFKNKRGLLTAFAAEGFDRLAATITDTLGRLRPRDGAGVLEAVGRGYVRFALENPEHFAIMFRRDELEPDDPALARASDRAFGLLTSTVQRCVAEGRLRPAQADGTAIAAWSLVHGLAALWLSRRLQTRLRRTDPDRLASEICRLFVDSLLRAP